MAEFQEILNDVVSDRAPGTTTSILNTRNGWIFSAEIEGPLDPIVLQTELGEDLREVCKLHVQGNVSEADLNLADRVKFTLYGLNSTHQVIKRRTDSADMFTTFWVQRITGKDAS